jgi:hypothetical protein
MKGSQSDHGCLLYPIGWKEDDAVEGAQVRQAAPQPHDKSSTEQFDTRPSMMRRPNSQQPVMADASVG